MCCAAEKLGYPHFKCFAHMLHNSLKHSFEAPEIQKLLKKIRELVKYFRFSPLKNNKLTMMQQKLNVAQIKLKFDVDTRWNSVYDSIERLIKSKQAIVNLGLEDLEIAELTLNLEEWQEIEDLRNSLTDFKDITEILSTSQTPSISMLKPLIFIISNNILSIKEEDGDICRTIKHLIFEDFSQRIKGYQNVDDLLILSSLLDPRFKNMNYLTQFEKSKAQKLLKEKFLLYSQKYKEDPNNILEENNNQTKRVLINTDALKKVFTFSNTSLNQKTDEFKEINKYLNIDELNICEDPLCWWKENFNKFRILSLVARDFLCVPATSVPSERVFSKAGNIVSNKRSSLSSKFIDKLIFLAENRTSS